MENRTLKTEFIRRYLNENPANGIIGAGYINPSTPPAGFTFSPQPYYSCSLILSGAVSLSDQKTTRLLKIGAVFQILPGEQKHLTPCGTPDTLIYHVCFGAMAFEALLSAGLLNPDAVFTITIQSYLKSWMPALSGQIKNTPFAELSETYLNIQKFTIHLHRESIKNHLKDHSVLIESAKQLLFDSCLTLDISFPGVAASLGLSYETFRKLFKEMTGQSPLQYVLEQKFHYALRFLTEGQSVKETAAAVGYADPYIFSRQFKKYMGDPPSYYKRKA